MVPFKAGYDLGWATLWLTGRYRYQSPITYPCHFSTDHITSIYWQLETNKTLQWRFHNNSSYINVGLHSDDIVFFYTVYNQHASIRTVMFRLCGFEALVCQDESSQPMGSQAKVVHQYFKSNQQGCTPFPLTSFDLVAVNLLFIIVHLFSLIIV